GAMPRQRISTRTISAFWPMHRSTFRPRLKGVLFRPESPDNQDWPFAHWRTRVGAPTDQVTPLIEPDDAFCDGAEHECAAPQELTSTDPVVLRTALMRESIERRRAECRANR